MRTPAQLTPPEAPETTFGFDPHTVQTNPGSSDRLSSVDTLRGLAALAVCWYHMTNGYGADSAVRRSGDFGWLGVEVFFVISGFILPYALLRSSYSVRCHWMTFVWKRMIRLEPPYLVAVLLALGLWHLSSRVPGFAGQMPPDLLSPQVLLHLGYLNGFAGYDWLIPVFWTLAIELQFYLLIAFAFPLVAARSQAVRGATAMAFACAFLANDSNVLVTRYLGLFLLGIAAFQYRCKLAGPYYLAGALALATWSVLVVHGIPAAGIALATALILACNMALDRSRALTRLGTLSYSLYLVHIPVGGRVVNLGKRYLDSEAGHLLLSLAATATSIAAAYCLYRLVERPAQAWAAKIRFSAPAIGLERPIRANSPNC